MKVGTLVAHRKWGKGIVTEILTYSSHAFTPIRICWLNPKIRDSGASIVWQKHVTIMSEGE